MSNKTYRAIRRLLVKSGLDWEIRPGGKHLKVFVEGTFVTILPRSDGGDGESAGGHKNLVTRVNKAIDACR